jgi:site-specific recombinase XerC
MTRRGYLARNPALEISKPRLPKRVPRALPPEQVALLLEVIERPRDRAMAWLMVGMGLRCGEVASSQVEDWDQRSGTLFVQGKGEHERVLPVPSEVAAVLRDHLAERRAGATGPMFRSLRSPAEGLRPHSISRLVGEWMLAAEIKRAARDGVSAHALRHTCASDVLDRCGDLRLVQNLLGHGNVATTSVYLRRASLGQLRNAMEGRDYSR